MATVFLARVFLAGAVAVCVADRGVAMGATVSDKGGVLIEAESFDVKGGWVVDQQFVDVMGSSYLLAHGLGRPVEDARTTARIPADGRYRVWVRTRNWAPGDWKAPGRFRVLIGGKPLEPEFGTEPGWAWQDGGAIDLKAGTATVVLHDLTGFDGRCDAIYLGIGAVDTPPNEGLELRTWRSAALGMPATPAKTLSYDAVVVGGGIAGCAAALAAAEKGVRVALIHDRPLLGGNASSEIRVHTIGIVGKAGGILNKINTHHWPNGSPSAIPDQEKRQRNMESVEGLDLFLSWRAYDAVARNGRITAVLARHIETGEACAFTAPVFIDSTGDGWVGFWAGADYRYGREPAEQYGEAWEQHGDLWSPKQADNRIMGSSLLWYAKPREAAEPFPDVPWAVAVAGNNADVKGEWFWEYSDNSLDAIQDGEAIRDHLLRAIYGSFANAKRKPDKANYRLEFVGYLLGKRESRRLMGDYLYTLGDIVDGRDFPDAVVEETRDVDLHYQRVYRDASYPFDYLSTALFKKVPRYRVPFRCLYSRNVENLMMAGRCFSTTHVALGGPRVMNTCGQMGVAVGYAAYLCKQYGTTPRGVYTDHCQELVTLVSSVAPDTTGGADEGDSGPPEIEVMAPGDPPLRVLGRYEYSSLPAELAGCLRVIASRGDMHRPGSGYRVTVNQPVTAYLAVHDRGEYTPPAEWRKTGLTLDWKLGKDTVYKQSFPAGAIVVPAHTGRSGNNFGIPDMLLIAPTSSDGGKLIVTPDIQWTKPGKVVDENE